MSNLPHPYHNPKIFGNLPQLRQFIISIASSRPVFIAIARDGKAGNPTPETENGKASRKNFFNPPEP